MGDFLGIPFVQYASDDVSTVISDTDDIYIALITRYLLENNLECQLHVGWAIDNSCGQIQAFRQAYDELYSGTDMRQRERFFLQLSDGAIAIIVADNNDVWDDDDDDIGPVYVNMVISARDRKTADEILVRLKIALPEAEVPEREETEVYMNFWNTTVSGPSMNTRLLATEDWKDIRANYTSGVQASLDNMMMQEYRPRADGKLILLHGLPGSGKTFCIRSLCRSWTPWCTPHYIIDRFQF